MAKRNPDRTREIAAIGSASDNECPVNCESVGRMPYRHLFAALSRLGVEHLNAEDCSTLRRQFRAGISRSDLSSAFRVPIDVIDVIAGAR